MAGAVNVETNKYTVMIVGMVLATAAGVALFVWYKAEKVVDAATDAASDAAKAAADAAKKVWDGVTDDDNPVYDGVVGGIGRKLTGDDDFSLGSWFFDVTHGDYDPNK